MPGRTPCPTTPCGSYAAGHLVHVIHAKHVGRTPWQWRDGVVVAVRGQAVRVGYVDLDHEVRLWHHRPLRDVLDVGAPVRVHERYYVLGGPFGWLSVVVTGGLGPVADPEHPDLRAADAVVPVVDLATGVALPVDHLR